MNQGMETVEGDPPRMIVGISGASGSVLALRMLAVLKELGIERHLIITAAGKVTLLHETGMQPNELGELADVVYPVKDIAAKISSGSYKTLGMVIIPCSMKSLAEIASGVTSNLLSRAADVVLKERRRLILVTRETPLHLGHLRNMISVTEMGGIIFPPVPAFYTKPRSIEEMTDHLIGRILDLFGLESGTVRRWQGLHDAPTI